MNKPSADVTPKHGRIEEYTRTGQRAYSSELLLRSLEQSSSIIVSDPKHELTNAGL